MLDNSKHRSCNTYNHHIIIGCMTMSHLSLYNNNTNVAPENINAKLPKILKSTFATLNDGDE